MNCPNCGLANWDWAVNCAKCGRELPDSEARRAANARRAAERGDFDRAVGVLREASASPTAGPRLAVALADRGSAKAKRAMRRVEIRAPNEETIRTELEARLQVFLAAKASDISKVVDAFRPPRAPWWRRRPRVTIRRVLGLAAWTLVLLLVFSNRIAAAIALGLFFVLWLVDEFRDVRPVKDPCQIRECGRRARAVVRHRSLCLEHASKLRELLALPVRGRLHADAETVALLEAARSDLEEAAELDRRVVGENLERVGEVLARLGRGPGPPQPEPVTRRAPVPAARQEDRPTPRRIARKKKPRRR
jgi:hypothetical protein